jgi:hypothetical protein
MAVLAIVFTWAALGLALSGIGLLVARGLGLADAPLSRTFWLGWAGAITLLQAWCLVLPVDARAQAAVLSFGVAGFLLCPAQRTSWSRSLRASAGWLGVLAPAALWLADLARGPVQNGDSFLYHLPAVAWAEAYRAVPGLANLHGRLGFNNASTLYQALVDDLAPNHGGHHIAHGLLLLPILGRGLRGLVRLGTGRPEPRNALDAVFLVPGIDWALGQNLTSASPDLPAACLEIAIASELTAALAAGRLAGTGAALVLMSAVLISVKLSALGFAFGTCAAVVLAARSGAREQTGWTRMGAWAAAVLVPWAIRGVILSGYPLYPSTLGGWPVDWRVPEARAIEEAGIVLAWGRRPGVPWRQVLASSDWIAPWLRSMFLLNREVLIPVVLGSVLLAVSAFRWKAIPSRLWLLLFPAFAELAWWSVTSPDPRFAGAAIWLLPASGAALLIGPRLEPRLAVALGCFGLAFWPFTTGYRVTGPSTPALQDASPASVATFTTRSGLTLWVPQGTTGCWQVPEGGKVGDPLLCTPFPNEHLHLRRANDVGSGFADDSNRP